jgi:hypothetical protein
MIRKQSEGNDLAELMETLTEEIRVLRIAIDELREELAWGNRNAADFPASQSGCFRLHSMPADPVAEDWAKGLNNVAQETLDDADAARSTGRSGASSCGPSGQALLF